MIEKKANKVISKLFVYSMLILVTAFCVAPFLIILSASFSSEEEIMKNGYSLFIQNATLDAYRTIMMDAKDLISAYAVTITTTAVGGVFGTLFTAMLAYSLVMPNYKWGNYIRFYLFFTMLFGGGMIPSFIVITQWLHLKNNFLVLILPGLVSAWNVFMLRTYFSQVSMSLIEAARIDGANEFRTFFTIVLPVCKTGVVTILLLMLLSFWNEWFRNMLYISNDRIVNLQYYLSKILASVETLKKNAEGAGFLVDASNVPVETVRMAICIIAAGPMVFVFMFFQKYFVGGISVGSVKG